MTTQPPQQPAPEPAPTDDGLRKRWRAAGGNFHGPNVETGTMPEHLLLPFLRSLSHPAPADQLVAALSDKLGKLFGIGSASRSDGVILANAENAARRSRCLSAIEGVFFTTLDVEDGEEVENCALNWGADPDEYVEQFRTALASYRAQQEGKS